MAKLLDKQRIRRGLLKSLFRPFFSWSPLTSPEPGYTIVLGTPWALRQILELNLRFIAQTNCESLREVIVVFDRGPQEGGDEFIDSIRSKFPDLVLRLLFHETVPAALASRIRQSKFYASLNWTTGIKAAKTRSVILHDFDLYPLVSDYFERIANALKENEWRFTGAERTTFGGLVDSDDIIGTWALGVDAVWLRSNVTPVDCFHAVADFGNRRVDLDAFSLLQSRTDRRGFVEGLGVDSFAHVRNLCSTYLRFIKGEAPNVVWRLHYLWYLEELCDRPEALRESLRAMDEATTAELSVADSIADFSEVHVTCANVLRSELERMETALFGRMRPEIAKYCESFEEFLRRFGDSSSVPSSSEGAAPISS